MTQANKPLEAAKLADRIEYLKIELEAEREKNTVRKRWRKIIEAPDYLISDHGDVISFKNGVDGIELKKTRHQKGYLTVGMVFNGKQRTMLLHRLVAMAYIGSPPSKHHQAAHNDGNKTNNHYLNIRWATCKENIADKIIHGTYVCGSKTNSAKLSELDVLYIRNNYKRTSINKSNSTELARKFGVSKRTINDIVSRKNWKAIKEIEEV